MAEEKKEIVFGAPQIEANEVTLNQVGGDQKIVEGDEVHGDKGKVVAENIYGDVNQSFDSTTFSPEKWSADVEKIFTENLLQEPRSMEPEELVESDEPKFVFSQMSEINQIAEEDIETNEKCKTWRERFKRMVETCGPKITNFAQKIAPLVSAGLQAAAVFAGPLPAGVAIASAVLKTYVDKNTTVPVDPNPTNYN